MTVTKNGIRNYNLHGSYENTSDFANSLKVGAIIKEITVFYEPINTNLWQNEGKFDLSKHIPKVWIFLFRNKKLTLPLKGLWPVNPGLLWSFVYLLQALKFTKIRTIQLTDFPRTINIFS